MKLVFIDLDNTLIDSNYQLTVTESDFSKVIEALARKDILVGLCSDSAMITLQQWNKRLKLTGPIVAERGGVIWDGKYDGQEIICPLSTNWLYNLRESFIGTILKNIPDATIMIGDATVFKKSRNLSPAMTNKVFAINGFRLASFSFFALQPKDDLTEFMPNHHLLAHASDLVTDLLDDFGKHREDLFWDEDPQYGILIIHDSITQKKNGVSTLIERLKPNQTFMIGDNMSDFLAIKNIAQHAVGNATDDYKNRAAFIAKKPLTQGVIECLNNLL